jgi:hypothetical protein
MLMTPCSNKIIVLVLVFAFMVLEAETWDLRKLLFGLRDGDVKCVN